MSLLRDMPLTIVELEERSLITCSTGNQVFSGSTANSIRSSQADPSCSTSTGITGRIIDRRGDDMTSRYQVAIPYVVVTSTRGSTETDRNIRITVKLQHGDSSGGGDMADYSTQSQPAVRNLFSTGRTSDMAVWDSALSTGTFAGLSSLPAYYDLRAAKRFIQAIVYAAKDKVTTESSGDEGARVAALITFAAGDQVPQNVPTTYAWSTSTST